MLQLDINKERILEFSVNIQGINYSDLQGFIKFTINDVFYGFPVKIEADKVTANIPSLGSIIKNLDEKELIDCKLEIQGDGFYMNPWTGSFKLVNPVNIKAELKETADDGVKLTATLIENTKKEQKINTKKKLKKKTEKRCKLSENKLIEIDSLVENFFKKETKPIIPEKKEKFAINESKKVALPKKETSTINNDPVALMESFGLKNKRVQDALLDRIGVADKEETCIQLRKMLGKVKEP